MVGKSIPIVLFLAVILAIAGCGKNKAQYGEAFPANVAPVALKDIVANPEAFKDKEVLVDVNYGNYCCESDFVCKQGLEAMEVYPAGFPTPKLDKGTPIRVFGYVRDIAKKPQTAQEGEEKGEEGEEEGHHEIYIEAKGMEVR